MSHGICAILKALLLNNQHTMEATTTCPTCASEMKMVDGVMVCENCAQHPAPVAPEEVAAAPVEEVKEEVAV